DTTRRASASRRAIAWTRQPAPCSTWPTARSIRQGSRRAPRTSAPPSTSSRRERTAPPSPPPAAPPPLPPAGGGRVTSAPSRIAALAPRLPHLTLRLSAKGGASVVVRDG